MSSAQTASILYGQVGKAISDSVTRKNDTTAYSANDVISTSAGEVLAFENVSNMPGTSFIITGSRMRVDVAAVPSGMSGFRLHLYNAAPTAIADNAAFDLPSGDRAKYLGYIALSTPSDLGATLWAQDDNVNFSGKLASGSTTIYGILETLGAFTPTASAVKTITLNVVGV